MKYTLLALFSLLFECLISAQIPKIEWTKTGGGNSNDIGIAIATDSGRNVYTLGHFNNTVDFDPGSGITNLTSNGGLDVFIQKLDKHGNFVWAKNVGGSGTDEALDIETTSSGDVLISGIFFGTVDFDPGPGNLYRTSNGSGDAFILRLDSNGNAKWAVSFGANWWDKPFAIEVDHIGNTYVTGYFQNTVDFDPGPGVHNKTASAYRSLFILKLDINGLFNWVRTYQGYGVNEGKAIQLDSRGNIFVTGLFTDSVDFDPGPGVYVLSTPGIGAATDIFIQKLNSAGNHIWTKSFGGTNVDHGYDLAIDGFDNVYLLGTFIGTVDFDPGPSTYVISGPPSIHSVFVEKLDSNGNFIWVSTIVGSESIGANGIACDQTGNVYFSGQFSGTVDFDPGSGVQNTTSKGSRFFLDVYVEKLDHNGNMVWYSTLESPHYQGIFDLHQDLSGSLYITGRFSGTLDFDPGPGISNYSSNGDVDYFLQKIYECIPAYSTDVQYACDSMTWLDGKTYYASNNAAQYVITDGAANGCDSIVILALQIDNSSLSIDSVSTCDSLVWIDGKTYYADNDTAQYTVQNGASNGCDSIVFLNLDILNSYVVDSRVACDSLTWIDGVTYYSDNNSATFILSNVNSCDSVLALDLKINYSNSSVDIISTCDSLTWIDGFTYKANNSTATHLLSTKNGCDSLVQLNLNVSLSGADTSFMAACDSFIWINGRTYFSSGDTAEYKMLNKNGCDSMVYLNLTISYSSIGVDSVVACKRYKWIDGNIYYVSNSSATDTLVGNSGCDSVVFLNLIINSADTTVVQSIGTLTASAQNASYQWYECSNGLSPIVGETDSVFFPKNNGSYLVVVNQNGCIDTSECVDIVDVGIVSVEFGDKFKVYPNPTSENVTISLGDYYHQIQVELFNPQGKLLYWDDKSNMDGFELELPDGAGMYMVKLSSRFGLKTLMLLKQ